MMSFQLDIIFNLVDDPDLFLQEVYAHVRIIDFILELWNGWFWAWCLFKETDIILPYSDIIF